MDIETILQLMEDDEPNISMILDRVIFMAVKEFGAETTMHMIMTSVAGSQIALGLVKLDS